MLTKLGFANSIEIIDYFNQIIKEEYTSWDEIHEAFDELYCDTGMTYFSLNADAAMVNDAIVEKVAVAPERTFWEKATYTSP